MRHPISACGDVGGAHLAQCWHPTGTLDTLGAAVAAGSLLGLTAEQMIHAIGTAGSQSSGLMSAQFSSMVKRLNAGHAAQSGSSPRSWPSAASSASPTCWRTSMEATYRRSPQRPAPN